MIANHIAISYMWVEPSTECGGSCILPPSPAGGSSVERALDGGGVPLMRERAKEGTNLSILERLYYSYFLDTTELLD